MLAHSRSVRSRTFFILMPCANAVSASAAMRTPVRHAAVDVTAAQACRPPA